MIIYYTEHDVQRTVGTSIQLEKQRVYKYIGLPFNYLGEEFHIFYEIVGSSNNTIYLHKWYETSLKEWKKCFGLRTVGFDHTPIILYYTGWEAFCINEIMDKYTYKPFTDDAVSHMIESNKENEILYNIVQSVFSALDCSSGARRKLRNMLKMKSLERRINIINAGVFRWPR